MENQDHKITRTPSLGHESHAPYLCHKCSWPFPNSHPSARHRRAHKKVCGKVEGYKLSESEAADNSTHSAVSDDEHHSDGDQQTPSPKGEKASLKQISSIGSCRSEDEAFSDAVTEFSDSGISPGIEERLDDVKGMSTNVKADAIGGISGSLHIAAGSSDPESLESATNQPEAAKSLGTMGDTNPVKSEKPVDASLQDINATGYVEAKQVQMSSVQPNDLKGIEDINTGEGYVDAVDDSVEVPQSVASDTDGKTSNNEIYESQQQEEEARKLDPLSLPSDLLGVDKKISSPVESKLLEADEQVTHSVPIEADLLHKERENADSGDLKLDLSEADVTALDIVNVDKEQEQLDKVEQDKQRISIEPSPLVQAPSAPIVELEADSSEEIDGRSQAEFSDSSKPEEGREDVHAVSFAKDLPALDNPELLLEDFKDHNKFKSSFPLDLGSSEVIYSAEDNVVAATEVSPSFVDTGRPDGNISSVALDVSGDQVSEEKVVVSAEDKMDSSGSIPLVQAPSAPIVELEADSSKEIDGRSRAEFSDSSKPEEGRGDVHAVSLAKDLPALDNTELLLEDFKDHNKFKSSFPLDLGSSEVICSAEDDVAATEVSQSFVDTGRPDGNISLVALDVSGDQVSEEKVVVSAEDKMDSSGLTIPNTLEGGVSSIPNSNGLKESEDSSKNSLPADHSDMNTIISFIQEEAKQTTDIDDPVIESTKTSFTIAENKGGHPEDELLANKETTLVDTSCLSEANQTIVTLGESDHDEHVKARPEHPIVVGGETEEKLEAVSECDKTICSVVEHDHATDTTVHESRDETFHEASKESTIRNGAKLVESASATDSKEVIDCDVKEPTGLLADTDLDSHVDDSHTGDGLKSATGVISSASQNEGNEKLIKQNDTVSAVDMSMNSSSRTDSLDANWGSVSVLSTQSESTAVPDAEATDARGLEKAERDLQKPTFGAEECHPDKSDVYEPPSFMTLVEPSVSADKKAAASEIETQLNAQQPKTEALKAGWFPSITNVVNESQGRKKNEEIIAKVTNWSTGKQHTPLKNLLGEAKSPNAKQVPSVNNKDESAIKKNGATVTTVNSILSSEAPTEQAARKEVEKEWNSPARYPVDIKKEKRKSKPYWVPFVCCSSVHQDA